MKVSIWKELIIIIIIFAGIWAVFTFWPVPTDDLELTLSVDKEQKLADVFVESILSQYEAINDPYIDSVMEQVSSRLTGQIDSGAYEYTIRIIENEEINAFTSLGGNIFICTGLIKFTENPEELAAVLAHEIGHVENRDVVHKLIKEIGINVLFAILTGGDQIIVGEISKMIISTSFDRHQEAEADKFAFDLLKRSRISPKRLAQLFIRLNDQKGSYPENLEILMSHPHSKSRLETAIAYPLPDNFVEEPYNINWDVLKEKLAGLNR